MYHQYVGEVVESIIVALQNSSVYYVPTIIEISQRL